ncbi:MAG TPA: class I SAM-dependent methyltransferase, partial [Oscillatoriaceae cyanobacterium]
KHHSLKRHYEACLEAHGDTHQGVNWSRREEAEIRYEAMLGVVRPQSVRVTMLDCGCGASHLLEYLRRTGRDDLEYAGLDISEKFVALCRQKFPEVPYYCLDVLEADPALPVFDYLVLNGVFTNRTGMDESEMWDFFERLLVRLWPHVRHGLAFNVMTKHVDWERDDLFHVPFDALAAFLKRSITRHFVIRNDYGLYDYTVYLYRQETAWPSW